MASDQGVEALGAVELGPEVVHLALERATLRGLTHQGEDLIHVEGLGDVVVGAPLDGLDGRAHILDRRDDDDGDTVVESQDLGEKGRPGRPRHAHVEQDHVHPSRAKHLESLDALVGLEDLELALENDAEGFANALLVVDDERHGSWTGSVGAHGFRACPGP